MSLEEKSKYGYGFDLNKFKIDPSFGYSHIEKPKPQIKDEMTRVKDDICQPPAP
jgi:hypothetical protein